MQNEAIDPAVRIGHADLRVADLDRSLSFYRDALGFGVSADGRAAGRPMVLLAAGDHHDRIGLKTFESAGATTPCPATPASTTSRRRNPTAANSAAPCAAGRHKQPDRPRDRPGGPCRSTWRSLRQRRRAHYDLPRADWFDAAGRRSSKPNVSTTTTSSPAEDPERACMTAPSKAARRLTVATDGPSVTEQMIPALAVQPGYAGALNLVDRDSGHALMIVLWDTEAQARRPLADYAEDSCRRSRASRRSLLPLRRPISVSYVNASAYGAASPARPPPPPPPPRLPWRAAAVRRRVHPCPKTQEPPCHHPVLPAAARLIALFFAGLRFPPPPPRPAPLATIRPTSTRPSSSWSCAARPSSAHAPAAGRSASSPPTAASRGTAGSASAPTAARSRRGR